MSENTSDTERTVYNLFGDFLDKFKEGKSLFSVNKVFTEDYIKALIAVFIDGADASKDLSFNEKLKKQFNNVKEDTKESAVKELMANVIWLWFFAVEDITLETKKKQIIDLLGEPKQEKAPPEENKEEKYKDLFPENPIMPGGQYYKTNKYFELKFIIALFKHLINEDSKDPNKKIKESIIKYIKKDRNPEKEDGLKSVKKIATQNILLHLCEPDNYEPIANYGHKKAIVDAFSSLLKKENENTNEIQYSEATTAESTACISEIDTNIKKIKVELKDQLEQGDVSFYSNQISQFWNFKGNESNAEFSEFNALKYKKQIVFYGPPGTSKTYTAKELAKMLIRQKFIQEKGIGEAIKMLSNNKDIDNFDNEYKKRIHNLQLHQNYSYEDFIAGMKIVNNETKWEKGYLLKLIDKIKNENTELPYVLILDEINRVDLSRLFGELFSAIEDRSKAVKLSAVDESEDNKENKEFLELKVPRNLYFIGTMNQIDFSLERIDFALRRRFVWYFYGYKENKLREIIEQKCSEPKINIVQQHIEELIRRASEINKELQEDDDFGKEWEIGHTFFGEIVDIVKSMEENKKSHSLYVKSKEGKLTDANEPVKVLWHISIKPMLEAYCGNLDKKSKKEKLDKLSNIFLKGKR